MRHMRLTSGLVLLAALFAALPMRAAVKTEEKSQVKFEGMLGRMAGWFGGRAMKEGMVSTVAVKGNRKAMLNEYGGEIIDLDEGKVYTLDARKKSYEVVTFEEMKRRMQDAREKAAKSAREEQGKQAQNPQEQKMQVDFSVKESGQKRNINGFDCREVVMTIISYEKGKTIEQSGGMIMTSNMWLAPRMPAMKDMQDFDRRYAQKLGETIGTEQMAAAMAMYPGFKDMMGKMEIEKVNMDGTAILTVMTVEAVKSAEQVQQEQRQKEDSGDSSPVRGIGGFLGRKIMKKKEDSNASSSAPNRANIMTMNHELMSVNPSVSDADVAIPAGYKQK